MTIGSEVTGTQKHRALQRQQLASGLCLALLAVAGLVACAPRAGRPLAASGPSPLAGELAQQEAGPDAQTVPFEQAGAGEGATPEAPGLPIGARAPSFVLQDQEGRALALESLLEEGPVALVFFRSAGW